MVAIFVLCLALLSTARRILHSTPLTSGQLSISRAYDLDSPEIEALPKFGSAEMSTPVIQAAYADPDFSVAEPVMAAAVITPVTPQIAAARTMDAKPLFATPLPPLTQSRVPAPKKTANLLPVKKALRMRKPSRRAYNYAVRVPAARRVGRGADQDTARSAAVPRVTSSHSVATFLLKDSSATRLSAGIRRAVCILVY